MTAFTTEQRHRLLGELAHAYREESIAQAIIQQNWDDEDLDEGRLDELEGVLSIYFVKSEGDWREALVDERYRPW